MMTSTRHPRMYSVIQRAGTDSPTSACPTPGTVGRVTSDLSKRQACPPHSHTPLTPPHVQPHLMTHFPMSPLGSLTQQLFVKQPGGARQSVALPVAGGAAQTRQTHVPTRSPQSGKGTAPPSVSSFR